MNSFLTLANALLPFLDCHAGGTKLLSFRVTSGTAQDLLALSQVLLLETDLANPRDVGRLRLRAYQELAHYRYLCESELLVVSNNSANRVTLAPCYLSLGHFLRAVAFLFDHKDIAPLRLEQVSDDCVRLVTRRGLERQGDRSRPDLERIARDFDVYGRFLLATRVAAVTSELLEEVCTHLGLRKRTHAQALKYVTQICAQPLEIEAASTFNLDGSMTPLLDGTPLSLYLDKLAINGVTTFLTPCVKGSMIIVRIEQPYEPMTGVTPEAEPDSVLDALKTVVEAMYPILHRNVAITAPFSKRVLSPEDIGRQHLEYLAMLLDLSNFHVSEADSLTRLGHLINALLSSNLGDSGAFGVRVTVVANGVDTRSIDIVKTTTVNEVMALFAGTEKLERCTVSEEGLVWYAC